MASDKCSVAHCAKRAEKTFKPKFLGGVSELELCGEHADRAETAERYWGELVGDSGFVKAHLALETAYSLLGDAALDYQAGLDLSAALLCRASLEAALHATLSIRNPQFNSEGVLTQLELSGQYSNARLTELIQHAKNILSTDAKDCARQVKENGDYAAHLSERVQKQWDSMIKGGIMLVPFRMWVTKDDAEHSMRCVVVVLKELIHWILDLRSP
jgi:hypothetical protein